MTSITATLQKLTEPDLRELILKLASQDKSKTLLASAHRLALSILERNRAEQEQGQDKDPAQQQRPGARYMLSTPLPKVASADLRELARGEGAWSSTATRTASEAIFLPDSINPDGSVTGRYSWTCCGSDGAASAGCVSTASVPRDRQMRVLSNLGFMVGLRALPTTPTPGPYADSKTSSYFG
ncbi:hypothetical protein PG993_004217 [Apiospora rasikravindrae]|uniref:Transposase n=1 Tax=Apiospora rasikravindrae TaxID=990691 RepID=A0ABR1TEU9_9PEZI